MRLLVANRGEIAVRILRTARELGLETVAVYSDADRLAPHVRLADRAVRLGPAPAAESYLRAGAIVQAALDTSCDAIHPGYGFLSEDAAFARACEDAGIAFAGPSPEHLEVFGSKHTAREAAIAAGVPLLAGTGLLSDVDEALARAADIGYPVMLKATGGGGGIGMRACASADELRAAWDTVRSVAAKSFASSGVFLERLVTRARHVEVQVFGDGLGEVMALGTRDCSLQRRNQKVVEECPAPDLPGAVRKQLGDSAVALCSSVRYRSAGTVEYVYDPDRGEAAFLEVNTRLQVEHPVTEAVYGVDLVAWMLRLAQGDRAMFRATPVARGHAVEARVYAEDPNAGHRPSSGLVTRADFPAGARVDTWVGPGTTVTTHYDPLLAKVICTGTDRAAALANLREALAGTRVDGVRTNLGQLRAAAADATFGSAAHDTSTLDGIEDTEPQIDVVRGGTMTTVQDWPGRTGFWHVGVPPSGPMDDLSLRLGNLALGNPEGAPGLECTVDGVTLRFSHAAMVCVTGAPTTVLVDGAEVPLWTPVEVPAGATLDVRACTAGLRSYVLVRGGVDVPEFLGSAATFTLGGFGGHGGRALAAGDVLRPGPEPAD
ncbi:biotin carboxylase N-terminal domain-containing protein, partial [Amycolatopsis sp. SID8362]|uniref:ATP-binding protein n=1 Tax=Amycolatopsis sp. SID8362 TaxID=2690346 RepID=UPI00142C7545